MMVIYDQQYRLLIENIQELVCEIDINGCFTYVNPRYKTLLGYTPEELIGKPFLQFTHPDEKDLFVPGYKELVEGRQNIRVTLRFLFKNGEWGWFDCSANVFEKQPGEWAVVVISRDITKEKKDKEETAFQDKKYRTLIETTHLGFVFIDPDGRVVDANQEYARLAGYKDPKQILGHQVVEWTAPYDINRNTGEIKKCLKTGYIRNFEVDYIDRQGEIIPVEINSSVLETTEGIRIISLCHDIKERKQIERSLKYSQQYFATIFRSSPVYTSLTRLSDGKFYDINEAFLNFLGYSFDEVVGKDSLSLNIWANPQDREVMVSLLKERKKVPGFETAYRTRDGRIRDILLIADLVELENESYILSQSLDITIQKSSQEALRQSEERFSKIFHSNSIGISISNEEGKIIEANESLLKMMGYSYVDFIGHYGQDLIFYTNPIDEKMISEELKKKGFIRDYELELKSKNGKPIFVSISIEKIAINREKSYLFICNDINERKKIENSLIESEKRFHSIVENSDAGYFFIDKDGFYQSVNPAWVKLYRFDSKKEIIGHHIGEGQDPDHHLMADEVFQGIMAGDPRFLKGELKRRCKDGSIGYHTLSAHPVIRLGEIKGIEGFIIDSTERRLAEEALLENEKKYRSLFETMVEGVALHHLEYGPNGEAIDYRLVDLNPAFERQTGYKISESEGRLASELYGVKPAPYLDIYKEVVLSGQPYRFQTYYAPLKKYFDITVITPRPEWFATIFLDISERIKSEQTLQRYRLLEENINDIILFVQYKTGRILEANKGALDTYGYTHDELLSLSINNLLEPGTISGFFPKIDTRYNKGIHFETKHIRKNGEIFPVEVNSQVSMLNDEIIQIEVIRDITERKQTEEALSQSEHRFESLFRGAPIPLLEIDFKEFSEFINQFWLEKGGKNLHHQTLHHLPDEILNLSKKIKINDVNQVALSFFNCKTKADFLSHLVEWIKVFQFKEFVSDFYDILNGYQTSFEKEFRLQIPDLEEERWVKINIAIDPDDPNPLEHVLVSIIDFTARKHAENVLRQAEQRFRALFETMSQGVIYYDDEGYIIQANLAARKILGASMKELIGKCIYDSNWLRIGMDGLPIPEDQLPTKQTIKTGKAIHHAIMGAHNSVLKSKRWLDVSTVPQMREGYQQPYQAYIIFEDITERKLIENEKESLLERTRQHTERLSTIIQISSRLRQSQVEEEVIQVLIEQSISGLKADVILLGLIEGSNLVFSKGKGEWAGWEGVRFAIGDDFFQLLYNEKPFIFDPCLNENQKKLTIGFTQTIKNFNPCLLIPFKVVDTPIGFLVAGYNRELEEAEDLINLAETIGEMAGNTLQRMRLMGKLEKLASDRAKDLGALYNVISAASGSFKVDEVVRHMLEQVLLILDSTEGAVLTVDEGGLYFKVISRIGLEEVVEKFKSSPIQNTVEGGIVETAKPLLIEDLADVKSGKHPQRMLDDHYSYLGLPMRTHGRVTGVLLTIRKYTPFIQEEIILVSSIADHMALILDNLNLYQLYEQAAVLEERSRLARDLHDSATQSLYSVTLYAEASRTLIDKGNIEQSRQYLDRMIQTAKMALQEMRLLVYELRPVAIEQDGLAVALRKRLESVESRAGIQTQIEVDNLFNLSVQEEENLFWIAMEALNNSLRHASASQVSIYLKSNSDEVLLSVRDNGKGFNLEKGRQSGGMGLQNMQHRAKKIGGHLEILSTPGKGVAVNVHLPQSPLKETKSIPQE